MRNRADPEAAFRRGKTILSERSHPPMRGCPAPSNLPGEAIPLLRVRVLGGRGHPVPGAGRVPKPTHLSCRQSVHPCSFPVESWSRSRLQEGPLRRQGSVSAGSESAAVYDCLQQKTVCKPKAEPSRWLQVHLASAIVNPA